jgi:hypothetical protein
MSAKILLVLDASPAIEASRWSRVYESQRDEGMLRPRTYYISSAKAQSKPMSAFNFPVLAELGADCIAQLCARIVMDWCLRASQKKRSVERNCWTFLAHG